MNERNAPYLMLPQKILILFLSIFLSPFLQGAEPLVFATSGEQNDPFDKISQHVLLEAYRRIGQNISFKTLPPARALRLSNAGVIDGELHRIEGIDNTYPNLIKIHIPINQIEVLAFTIKNNITIKNAEDLKPYLIGIRQGVKFAENLTQGLKVHEVDRTEQLFRMLGLWRIDVALSTRTAGLKVIKRLDLKKVIIPSKPLVTLNLYHYLNKKHASIIPRITLSLQEMEREGFIQQEYQRTLAEILQQANPDD